MLYNRNILIMINYIPLQIKMEKKFLIVMSSYVVVSFDKIFQIMFKII